MHFATTITKNIGRVGSSKIVDFWFIDTYQKKILLLVLLSLLKVTLNCFIFLIILYSMVCSF